AQVHPFAPAGADAAYSRFGVMFFDDPVAAFANIRAALAPGGRLAFVCWRNMDLNPFMTLPLAAALPHLAPPPSPPEPGAPGPFAFADGARIRDILGRAGFSGVELTALDQPVRSGDVEESLAIALNIGPLGRALREQPAQRGPATAAIRAALERNLTAEGVCLASATWIVRARNGPAGSARSGQHPADGAGHRGG
ncbi:MAG TPA: methyltransferase domain-containing protein, partial [Caulobacteraceae bacterium]|nr:methyltransferase domain-containing protein [Caulobacteraceae bacterium]